MESEDGQIFVKNLAIFVRTHERALANALQSQRHQRSKNGQSQQQPSITTSGSIPSLHDASYRSYLPFSRALQPAKLTLTPHHLFYLLSKFEDLEVDVGPMNVRLENLQHGAGPSNYVSFLGHAPRTKGKQPDADSLRSVSSVRSVMSSVSSLWSNLTLGDRTAKAEKRAAQYKEDIRYLYSCFTKIPALKLASDHRARLIAGFEEFPFDTAVPLHAFKNVTSLEICDVDFRQFNGWDRLAEQLRTLTVRRANLDDPIDLLQHIVLDDMEKRRKRSFKTQPTTPSTPGAPWPHASPKARNIEMARTISAPNSPIVDQRRSSIGSPFSLALHGLGTSSEALKQQAQQHQRQYSDSPTRPPSSRQGSALHPSRRTGSSTYRRSSGSSEGSSAHDNATARHSTSDLLALGILPPAKWQFLRHLSLAENGLTFLSTSSFAPIAGTLQSLDLSGNLFKDVPDALASLTHLRALNLSNCMIDSLQSLSRHPLPAITTLNLHSNRLQSLSGIERLYSLERIDVRDNKLKDPTELARLTAIPDIAAVYVVKNPFTRTHSDYRITIFNLFRAAPGYQTDVLIDQRAPESWEKKQLVDRAPEPLNVPIVRPPLEDEAESPQAVAGGAPTEAELEELVSSTVHQSSSHHRRGHRRTTSDVGPQTLTRRKKPPRRRIVELSQLDSPTPSPSSTQPPQTPPPSSSSSRHPVPDLLEVEVLARTPTDFDFPTTPGDTPYHTAPTTQVAGTRHATTVGVTPSAQRTQLPRLLHPPAFASPTPGAGAPQIRDPSDDDLSPAASPHHDVVGPSDLYRQKLEALKHELGANWLAVLNNTAPAGNGQADIEGLVKELEHKVARGRSFSPSSRTSTIRGSSTANATVAVGARTLG